MYPHHFDKGVFVTFLFIIGMLFSGVFYSLAQILLPAGLVVSVSLVVLVLAFVMTVLLIVIESNLLLLSSFFLGMAAQSSLVTISWFLTGSANQIQIFIITLVVWIVFLILFRMEVSYRSYRL